MDLQVASRLWCTRVSILNPLGIIYILLYTFSSTWDAGSLSVTAYGDFVTSTTRCVSSFRPRKITSGSDSGAVSPREMTKTQVKWHSSLHIGRRDTGATHREVERLNFLVVVQSRRPCRISSLGTSNQALGMHNRHSLLSAISKI